MVHGDAAGCYTLGKEISERQGVPVWCPKNFESIYLAVEEWKKDKNDVILSWGSEANGITLLVNGPGFAGRQTVSESFFRRHIQPNVSVLTLVTSPPLWPSAKSWLKPFLTDFLPLKKVCDT